MVGLFGNIPKLSGYSEGPGNFNYNEWIHQVWEHHIERFDEKCRGISGLTNEPKLTNEWTNRGMERQSRDVPICFVYDSTRYVALQHTYMCFILFAKIFDDFNRFVKFDIMHRQAYMYETGGSSEDDSIHLDINYCARSLIWTTNEN